MFSLCSLTHAHSLAVLSKRIDMVKLCLDLGANPNVFGEVRAVAEQRSKVQQHFRCGPRHTHLSARYSRWRPYPYPLFLTPLLPPSALTFPLPHNFTAPYQNEQSRDLKLKAKLAKEWAEEQERARKLKEEYRGVMSKASLGLMQKLAR